MKKKLEDLRVQSFVTTKADKVKAGAYPKEISIEDPNDPTANTWCYWCPPETIDY
ncbi:MAG: pinensin family lanthipeptide [Cyclobacteriaceae bacterium]